MPDAASPSWTFYSTFNFELTLADAGGSQDAAFARSASFTQVSGLEIDLESTTLREGGYNLGERRLVGKTSHPAIVLKRGVTRDAGFWKWVQSCFDGTFPLPYVDGILQVWPPDRDAPGTRPAVWKFKNAIATKVRSADLSAASGSEVAIEELHLVHERLERVP